MKMIMPSLNFSSGTGTPAIQNLAAYTKREIPPTIKIANPSLVVCRFPIRRSLVPHRIATTRYPTYNSRYQANIPKLLPYLNFITRGRLPDWLRKVKKEDRKVHLSKSKPTDTAIKLDKNKSIL